MRHLQAFRLCISKHVCWKRAGKFHFVPSINRSLCYWCCCWCWWWCWAILEKKLPPPCRFGGKGGCCWLLCSIDGGGNCWEFCKRREDCCWCCCCWGWSCCWWSCEEDIGSVVASFCEEDNDAGWVLPGPGVFDDEPLDCCCCCCCWPEVKSCFFSD